MGVALLKCFMLSSLNEDQLLHSAGFYWLSSFIVGMNYRHKIGKGISLFSRIHLAQTYVAYALSRLMYFTFFLLFVFCLI